MVTMTPWGHSRGSVFIAVFTALTGVSDSALCTGNSCGSSPYPLACLHLSVFKCVYNPLRGDPEAWRIVKVYIT